MSLSKEEIIRMAREAGFIVSEYTGGHRLGETSIFDHAGVDIFNGLKRFADFVAAKKSDIGMAEAYRCGYESGAAAEREALSRIRAPKPRELPPVGTGALWSEQQFCFAKGYREGAAALRKAIRARGNGGEK